MDVFASKLKCFGRVRREQHRVALSLQQSLRQLAQPVVIVNHEHRLRPSTRPINPRRHVHD
jgi:hypothetical protein